MDGEELVVADHGAEKLEAALEDPLHERLAFVVDSVMDEREQRDEALGADFTLRAQISQEGGDCIREALTFE